MNSSHLTNLNGVRGRSRYHAAMEHNTVDRAPDADVLIVGAGPAGLALASALSGLGLRCTIVEQQGLPLLEAPGDDGREIALTHRARRVLESLGIWRHFSDGLIAPMREARVLDGDSPSALRFSSTGDDALGWLVPNHEIRRAALVQAISHPSVRLLCDAQVTALETRGMFARLTLADGRALSAPLVVAADSRFSQLRRMAGIGASMRDFGRTVVVGRIAHEKSNGGIALECFRYGNTLALLPMNGNQASAVITVASDRAGEWQALDDLAFAARIESQLGGRLGAIRSVGARHAYPLVGVYAHRFAAPRFALVGDAAVGMHPVTAHGYNFGLYGVEVLARSLAWAWHAGRDLGELSVLQPYESTHRRTTLPVYLGTNAVVSLFTDESGYAKVARRAVLAVSERAPGLSALIKGAIRRQLTGNGAAIAAGR